MDINGPISRQMDANGPLSSRANAFSISSLMSGPYGDSLLGTLNGGLGYSACVPNQRSTDCLFEWGQNGPYGTGLKGMEGNYKVLYIQTLHINNSLFELPWNFLIRIRILLFGLPYDRQCCHEFCI